MPPLQILWNSSGIFYSSESSQMFQGFSVLLQYLKKKPDTFLTHKSRRKYINQFTSSLASPYVIRSFSWTYSPDSSPVGELCWYPPPLPLMGQFQQVLYNPMENLCFSLHLYAQKFSTGHQVDPFHHVYSRVFQGHFPISIKLD